MTKKAKTRKITDDSTPTLEEFQEALMGGHVHMGPENISNEDVAECLNGMDEQTEHLDFVYTQLASVDKELQPGFKLQWGARGFGFGEFTFSTKDGLMDIDFETGEKKGTRRSKDLLMAAFANLIGWDGVEDEE